MAYIKPKSPLRYNKSNNYFYPVTTVDQIIINENSRLNDYSIISTREINAVLLIDNWIESNEQYAQTITIDGLTEDYNVDVKIAYTNNLAKDLLINESASYIKYAIQNDDKVTFYCLKDKPIVDIPIELEVYI